MDAGKSSFHRAADTAPALWGPGDTYTFLATSAETGGAYFVMEGLVPPDAGPPPHIHHHQDESYYMIEGLFGAVDPVELGGGLPQREWIRVT